MGEVNCPRAGKWIGECRFEGRYETGEARLLTDHEIRRILMVDMPDALKATRCKTYVRDVCTRCGRTIERQPTQEPTR